MKWIVAFIASGASFAFVLPTMRGPADAARTDRPVRDTPVPPVRPVHGPVTLDQHTLSDIGIEPGSLTWLPPR